MDAASASLLQSTLGSHALMLLNETRRRRELAQASLPASLLHDIKAPTLFTPYKEQTLTPISQAPPPAAAPSSLVNNTTPLQAYVQALAAFGYLRRDLAPLSPPTLTPIQQLLSQRNRLAAAAAVASGGGGFPNSDTLSPTAALDLMNQISPSSTESNDLKRACPGLSPQDASPIRCNTATAKTSPTGSPSPTKRHCPSHPTFLEAALSNPFSFRFAAAAAGEAASASHASHDKVPTSVVSVDGRLACPVCSERIDKSQLAQHLVDEQHRLLDFVRRNRQSDANEPNTVHNSSHSLTDATSAADPGYPTECRSPLEQCGGKEALRPQFIKSSPLNGTMRYGFDQSRIPDEKQMQNRREVYLKIMTNRCTRRKRFRFASPSSAAAAAASSATPNVTGRSLISPRGSTATTSSGEERAQAENLHTRISTLEPEARIDLPQSPMIVLKQEVSPSP